MTTEPLVFVLAMVAALVIACAVLSVQVKRDRRRQRTMDRRMIGAGYW